MNDGRRWLRLFTIMAVCFLTALCVSPIAAAQLGDIPVTAEFAAGMRAIAAMDPDEKIRNPDSLAKQFLSPAYWFWTALDEDYDKSKQFIKFYRVSSYYTINACTKHIDGILQAAAEKDLEQVVIIGAGLDSRAYRFQEQMPGVRFFEDIARGDFSKMPWARFQAVRMAAYGHPWKFGIAPGKAGAFVTRRGFEVISDLGSGELAQRYLLRSDGSIDGKPTPYVRMVHAVVKN